MRALGSTQRLRVTIVSHDKATTDDGTWQSGRLRAPGGREWRFVARGVPFMAVGSEAEVRARTEVIAAEHRSPYSREIEQIVIDECFGVHLPTTPEGVARFIAENVTGIGSSGAAKIVTALGASAIALLNENPALLEQVDTGKRGRDWAFTWTHWRETWREHQSAYDMGVRLASRGVSYRHARRIISFFRSADVAEIVLLRRPYRLIDVPGFGWERTDAIAKQLGVASDADDRLVAAVVTKLDEVTAEEGHSCLPPDDLARRAAERAGSLALARRGIACAMQSGAMVNDGGLCYRPDALEAEWTVGRHVRRRAVRRYEVSADVQPRIAQAIAEARLSLDQAWAVWQALTSGLMVLTGGPGTGKTTTAATIVRCANIMGLRLRVVAPTGKAAARATKVTGASAGTVHRLIGGRPGGRRKTPVDADLVIVDETSMASLEMAAWLLENLRADARVVVMGDPDQLPSVDHGAVLRDLLAAPGVPIARLVEVHRQRGESGIVDNAYSILARAELVPAPDFVVVNLTQRRGRAGASDEASEKDAARAAIVRHLNELAAEGVDLVSDVQVLTPVKRKTNALGVPALNRLLQDTLNPHGTVGPEIKGGRRVRVGDRVMQMRNDYSLASDGRTGAGEAPAPEGVFNGEVGVVVEVGPASVTVRFDEVRTIRITGYRCFNLQLAWATTIHRSQGSEWPVAIVVAHRSQGAMLTRELLYTAVTRAKRRVILVTDDEALAWIRTDPALQGTIRHTGLVRHLAV